MTGRDDPMLSVALKATDEGWAWWVIDEAGDTVAHGRAADREAAHGALRTAYGAATSHRDTGVGIAA